MYICNITFQNLFQQILNTVTYNHHRIVCQNLLNTSEIIATVRGIEGSHIYQCVLIAT